MAIIFMCIQLPVTGIIASCFMLSVTDGAILSWLMRPSSTLAKKEPPFCWPAYVPSQVVEPIVLQRVKQTQWISQVESPITVWRVVICSKIKLWKNLSRTLLMCGREEIGLNSFGLYSPCMGTNTEYLQSLEIHPEVINGLNTEQLKLLLL